MSPTHALEDQLLLHELVAYCPAARALNQIVVVRRRLACAVADHTLHTVAHFVRRDRSRYRKSQEPGSHYRNEAHREKIDVLKARIALVDVVKNEIHLTLEEAFPRPRDRLEVQMQPCARAAV